MFCLLALVAVYEQDSEPAIIADKLTRLLSEAEQPPLKTTQDQEVTKYHFIVFRKLTGYKNVNDT